MQDITSSIQPLSNSSPKCICWLYGFAIIGMITYIWFADPFGIRAFVAPTTSTSSTTEYNDVAGTSVLVGTITVSEEQMALLKLVGIDPEELEQQDPAVLRTCIEAEVGVERARQIESGQVSPTVADVLALKRCVE